MPPNVQLMEQTTNFVPEMEPSSDLGVPHHPVQQQRQAQQSPLLVPTSRVKCVLVGDGAVGKTSLIVSYTTNGYPTEYLPTAFDDYSVKVTVDSKPVQLQLCDTAGQDEFDTIRPLCYPNTDIFLVCFSVVSPTSFNNIPEKWVPEIRRHAPRVPILLVGTQSDLRNNVQVLIKLDQSKDRPVSEQEAARMALDIGAVHYVECSALTQKNLKDVFDQAILSSLNYGLDFSQSQLRKSSRKKYSLGHSTASLKKTGWKKFCCLL